MITPSVRFVATAASIAFPPETNTASPAAEARWCGEATQALGNLRASRIFGPLRTATRPTARPGAGQTAAGSWVGEGDGAAAAAGASRGRQGTVDPDRDDAKSPMRPRDCVSDIAAPRG